MNAIAWLGAKFCSADAGEQKNKIFERTQLAHLAFLLNNAALFYSKVRSAPYAISMQLVNDLGCTFAVMPCYSLWMYHYFKD